MQSHSDPADFSIRQLRESELDAWFDHLEECFRAKGTPRSHFERHWRCDPHKRYGPGAIFVAVTLAKSTPASDAGQIVSTLRVFERQVVVSDAEGRRQVLRVGGVGEVCTRSAFRGRGLATRVLEAAVRWMGIGPGSSGSNVDSENDADDVLVPDCTCHEDRSGGVLGGEAVGIAGALCLVCQHALGDRAGHWRRRRFDLCSLHSGNPAIQQFYAKLGWKAVPVRYVTVRFDDEWWEERAGEETDLLRVSRIPRSCRRALIRLAPLYAGAVAAEGSCADMSGPTIRSPEYWGGWVHGEHANVCNGLRVFQLVAPRPASASPPPVPCGCGRDDCSLCCCCPACQAGKRQGQGRGEEGHGEGAGSSEWEPVAYAVLRPRRGGVAGPELMECFAKAGLDQATCLRLLLRAARREADRQPCSGWDAALFAAPCRMPLAVHEYLGRPQAARALEGDADVGWMYKGSAEAVALLERAVGRHTVFGLDAF